MRRQWSARPIAFSRSSWLTTLVVTAALCWAGWRLLDQQRTIDKQREREQLENRADAIAADIRGRLAETGERLAGWLSIPRAIAASGQCRARRDSCGHGVDAAASRAAICSVHTGDARPHRTYFPKSKRSSSAC